MTAQDPDDVIAGFEQSLTGELPQAGGDAPRRATGPLGTSDYAPA